MLDILFVYVYNKFIPGCFYAWNVRRHFWLPPSLPSYFSSAIDVGTAAAATVFMQDWTIFVHVLFCGVGFLLAFSQRFSPIDFFLSFFPWLVLGNTFLNFVIVCALSSVFCVLLVVIMTLSFGVHRAPNIIFADAW